MRTPILCYHKVGEPHDRFLNVSVRDFRKQVHFLRRRFPMVTLAEFRECTDRCAVLTFDDAYACSTEPLLAAARDLGATGTVFPVTAFVGDASRWDGEKARALADWDALSRLRDAGYEIGNHTHTHADLSAASTAGQAHGGGPISPPQAAEASMAPSPCSEAEGGGSGRGSGDRTPSGSEDARRSWKALEGKGETPSSRFPLPQSLQGEPSTGPAANSSSRLVRHESGQPHRTGFEPPPQVPQPSMSPSPCSEAEGGGSGRGSTSATCRIQTTACGDAVRVVRDIVGAAEELAAAEREIEARLGARPRTFAYPFGRYDSSAVRAVRARGYLAAVTVRYGIASNRHDPHLLPRILISYSDGLPGLLYKLYIRPLLGRSA